jgi:RNA polymerase sigma-70 factor, ECF subfamily
MRVDLLRALTELPEGDRRLLQMRYEEDLTQASVAIRLGIPEGTVKVRLHRLRARLRHALRE